MEKAHSNQIKLPSIVKKHPKTRVKSYLRAYYSSSLLSTRSEPFKIKTAKEELLQKPPILKPQTSGNKEKQKNPEEVKKKTELLYEISVAKSDRIEILRDLSTYEYELSNKIHLQDRLDTLTSSLGTLPQMFEKLQDISSENQVISMRINEGFTELHSLTQSSIDLSYKSEKFPVRPYSTLRKMRLLYTSLKIISGTRVIISVKGDSFLENFLVSIMTTEGEVCSNVAIKLDILAVDTLNQKVEVNTAIEQKIIPHLYLIYHNRTLQLEFDENFPNDKNSVIINLKNFGRTSVFVWQADESIFLHVTDPKYEKKINKSQLLSFEQSLSQIPLPALAKSLSAHLRYSSNRTEFEIEWLDSVSAYFYKKETTSNLMNEDYIKESLGTQSFARIWDEEVQINGTKYFVQCLAYHTLKKIVVKTIGGKSLEIAPETQAYKFISNLQSIDLSKHPATLCNSLELRKLIKSFFI